MAEGLAVLMVILIILAAIGWIMNISSLAATKTLTGMSLLRFLGVVIFPFGCILGFIPNAKEVKRDGYDSY